MSGYFFTIFIQVKDDIETLHEKFKRQHAGSKEELLTRKRDLPPVAGSIIWVRQIEKQLSAYMRRVEDVLGKGRLDAVWNNLLLFAKRIRIYTYKFINL